MDKDFDFDNIGKRTPYRTPDNFFEETQRKILERTVDEQRKKRRLKRIIPTVIAVAAVLAGILFTPSLRYMNTDTPSASNILAVDKNNVTTDPEINGLRNCQMRSWKSSSASLKTIYF